MPAATDRFLHGKHAWVTGASRGIGRAIVLRLAAAGASVAAGARSLAELNQLAEQVRLSGGNALALELDVTDRASVASFAAAAFSAFGPPDIVVNCAGVGIFRDTDQMTPEDFDRQIDVNLKGPWNICREAIPHLKRQGGGHIINIGSIAGSVAFRRGTAYCAAKAGLRAMTEALMHELREYDITTTLIAPGSVDTRFHEVALPNAHHEDQTWMLEPAAIADAVAHVLMMPPGAMVSYYEVRPLQTGK